MTPDFSRVPYLSCATAVLGLCLSVGARADLPTERVTVEPPISAKNRVYIADIAINYIADGKLHVVDADTGRYLGVVGSGFTGQHVVNKASRELIIATGYLSRGQRGTRTDIVEVWDADSLSFKHEIIIPPKRAMALNYEGIVRLSADGRWFFVQNATPASSVTVVDMKNRKVAAEIATPGCWAIYVPASRSDRFSSLCGDGTVSTVVLNSSGQQASRAVSAKLFDADKDPLFMQGEEDGDTYHFVSYLGNISSIAIGGKTAQLTGTWSLLTEAADAGWRPSGYQPLAVHPGTGRLYVTMHSKGYDGSHKNPAEEIWGFDMRSKQRVVRMPGYDSIALEPSRDGKRLYAIDIMKAELVVINLGATPTVHVQTQIGALPIQIEAY